MSSRSLSAYDKGKFFAFRFEDMYLPFCRMKQTSDSFLHDLLLLLQYRQAL